eukprot:CAMPEP_0183359334 /NCGR_PEP_ID=MMETSP0164_2-20130417/51891_1 /TAXON_ID=221442 /ORGANISM="Coccolithus pelagicus ssp braarudi, Strain PLY182g" /LENGTH=50 /DNA_ID=CAMNT_0025533413 /DNA_START=150 /DNA_END=298 /DNA_ORIENTATION=-
MFGAVSLASNGTGTSLPGGAIHHEMRARFGLKEGATLEGQLNHGGAEHGG